MATYSIESICLLMKFGKTVACGNKHLCPHYNAYKVAFVLLFYLVYHGTWDSHVCLLWGGDKKLNIIILLCNVAFLLLNNESLTYSRIIFSFYEESPLRSHCFIIISTLLRTINRINCSFAA